MMLHILIFCGYCLILSTDAQQGLPLPDEFPGLRFIPKTSFDCRTRPVGYYADPDPATRCQVYHMCDMKGNKFSYLCPNGTLFHQQHLICAHWYQVNCTRTLSLYEINKQMFPFDKFEPDVEHTSPQANSYQPQSLHSPRAYEDVSIANKPGTPRQKGKTELATNKNTVTSKFYGITSESHLVQSGSAVKSEEPLFFKQVRVSGKRKSSFPSSGDGNAFVAPKTTATTESAQSITQSLQVPEPSNAVLQLDDQLVQESTITASPAIPPQTFTTEGLAFGRRYASRRRVTRVGVHAVSSTVKPPAFPLFGDANDNKGNNIPPLQHILRVSSRPAISEFQLSEISPRRTSSKYTWRNTAFLGQAPPDTEHFGIPLDGTVSIASSTLRDAEQAEWPLDTATSQSWPNHQFRSLTRVPLMASADETHVEEELIAPEFGAAIPLAIETKEQRKNSKLTMKFPKDGRFQKKYGTLPINDKCPQCNPYFLKNDRCSPCVIIR